MWEAVGSEYLLRHCPAGHSLVRTLDGAAAFAHDAQQCSVRAAPLMPRFFFWRQGSGFGVGGGLGFGFGVWGWGIGDWGLGFEG